MLSIIVKLGISILSLACAIVICKVYKIIRVKSILWLSIAMIYSLLLRLYDLFRPGLNIIHFLLFPLYIMLTFGFVSLYKVVSKYLKTKKEDK